ncbi:MAG: DUF308 domain-containing protein [Bacteroidales bacterium]|nr:DUF308 domain-containing protein [Bacteroidales bacterium]
MDGYLENLAGKAGRTVKNWWLKLVAGIFLIAMGVIVFFYPVESYLTLSVFFGVAMLISGIVQIVIACSSRNLFMSRGYSVIGGVLDLILGIILCCVPGISAVTLPIILGCWLLYHSFMLIGLGSDLSSFGVSGSVWTIIGGILLLLFATFILFDPFAFGTSAVVAFLGTAFIVTGCIYIFISLKLKKIHTYFVKK